MKKIDPTSFPPLGGKPDRPAGAWSAPPKIPRKQGKISRGAQLGGVWIKEWEALGDTNFSAHTCGWIEGVIDRPFHFNQWKEAQMFYDSFIDEIEMIGCDDELMRTLEKAAPTFTSKIREILQKIRSGNFEVDQIASYKAHWYITLEDHYATNLRFGSSNDPSGATGHQENG